MSPPMKKRSYTADTVYVDAFLKGLEEGKAAALETANQSPVQQPQQQAPVPRVADTLRLVSLLRGHGAVPTSELFRLSELSLADFAATVASLKHEGLVEAKAAARGAGEILSLTAAGAALVS